MSILKSLMLLGFFVCMASAGIASAAVYTLDFNSRPGPSGIPGAPDQILYQPSDIYNYGGYRDVSQDFAGVGVHFSLNAGIDQIGGGWNPDGTPITTGDNNVLADGNKNYPVAPLDINFDLPQTQVTMDILDYINNSGTSNPVVLKSGGVVVDSFTLTAADELFGSSIPSQLAGRFNIDYSGSFDEIDLGLTGPSDGGLAIDNLTFTGLAVPEPTSLSISAVATILSASGRLRNIKVTRVK
jgi:hypothetical protein